jgi:isopenicillin-N epimerase
MRSEFDLAPSLIYLNAGTQSIAPRVVNEAVARHQRAYETNPTAGLVGSRDRIWRVQSRLARFFGGDPVDFFLRPNVTAALNQFILGAPLERGGEILATELEYGAIVNACRFRAEREGRKLRELAIPAGAADLADIVVSGLRPDTRMLLLSHVVSTTGLRFPLREIARETRRRGVTLVVDGAHAPGAFPLDFGELGDVDFYGGNLHKWMMGPKGTGFGWANKRHHDALVPLAAGWTTYPSLEPYPEYAGGNRFAARMLMLGCHDFAPYYAIDDTLDFWERVGPAAIHARIYELTREIETSVGERLGWPCVTPTSLAPPWELSGPMRTYELPERLAMEGFALMRRLHDTRGLQVAIFNLKGRWLMRLSAHVCNNENEIHRAASILADLV